MTTLLYAVNEWGSHPDADADDCWRGTDYATATEATAAYYALAPSDPDTAYVELTGPDFRQVRPVPTYDPVAADERRRADDRAWRLERANEAGMAFGCQGFNDVMGY